MKKGKNWKINKLKMRLYLNNRYLIKYIFDIN